MELKIPARRKRRTFRIPSRYGYYFRRACLYLWQHGPYFSESHWALRVSYHQYRERLDTYLRRYWPDKSKGEIRAPIRSGQILVNFSSTVPWKRVRKGDLVLIPRTLWEPLVPVPLPTGKGVSVLYEDDHLFIVNKPPGIVVHHNFNPQSPSLITDLFCQRDMLFSPWFDMTSNVIHRLDMFSSGVVLVSRSYQYDKTLKDLFANRQVYKEYRILVHGRPKPARGEIFLPIRKDESSWPSRMIVDPKYHRGAYTEYEVLESDSRHSLVKVILHTGRTHQIRVHFAHLGHPVVGDLKYGFESSPEQWPQGLMLQAHRIQFKHPFSGQLVDVAAPLRPGFALAQL